MGINIVGFICALVLAAIVILWIAFCMFCRERHKSEQYQYDILDLKHRNYQLAQEQEAMEAARAEKKKDLVAGIFILPSRRKQKDESYVKRPDYPESPPPMPPPGDKLAEIFNDGIADADIHYKDGIIENLEIESSAQYHSDV